MLTSFRRFFSVKILFEKVGLLQTVQLNLIHTLPKDYLAVKTIQKLRALISRLVRLDGKHVMQQCVVSVIIPVTPSQK